jgi:hypothetical protein
MTSVVPPAGKGTTSSILRVGYLASCALAAEDEAANARVRVASTRHDIDFMAAILAAV